MLSKCHLVCIISQLWIKVISIVILYVCVCVCIGVFNIHCVVFLLCFISYCVPYISIIIYILSFTVTIFMYHIYLTFNVLMSINDREYWSGNTKWTIHRNWQRSSHKTKNKNQNKFKKNEHNVRWTPLSASKHK
jgi:cytochrome b subunit of formate dehydrogenase